MTLFFKYLSKYLSAVFSIIILSILARPGYAELQQQITVDPLFAPTPLKADNKYYLVYEDFVTNFEKTPITLTSLQVNKQNFNQKQFAGMLHPIVSMEAKGASGAHVVFDSDAPKGIQVNLNFGADKKKPTVFVLKPGESKLIYIWLEFNTLTNIPAKLDQILNYNTAGGEYSVSALPVEVKKTPPIIVAPPLNGDHWVAVNGPSNTSEHRITHVIIHGHLYFAQRYAIDFVQLDNKGQTYSGDQFQNKSYYCYGKNILAVGAGKVVDVEDDMPENIPHSGKTAVPMNVHNAGGNHVVLELDPHHYAFYAHMIPHSITVKTGDTVKVGQVIGKVGNTGNSSEPHLHFHIVDGPSFLGANGIPYGFNNFSIDNMTIDGKMLPRKPIPESNQLVLENTLMNFK